MSLDVESCKKQSDPVSSFYSGSSGLSDCVYVLETRETKKVLQQCMLLNAMCSSARSINGIM